MRISQLRPGGRVIGNHTSLFKGERVPSTNPDSRTTVHIRTAATGATMDTTLAAYNLLPWQVLRQATQQRRLKMKTLLLMSALSLVLFVGGCNNSPAAPVPGPAGPQGQVGQTGQSGQQGDTGMSGRQGVAGQTGETGQTGYTGQTGSTGQTGDTGQTGQTGDTGRRGRTGDQGVQGQAAPCPAGEHRYTNPNTGNDHCVSN